MGRGKHTWPAGKTGGCAGIVLTRAVQLASAENPQAEADITLWQAPTNWMGMSPGGKRSRSPGLAPAPPDVEQVQFFGGFFIPFGGIYGLWPWFGFGFVI